MTTFIETIRLIRLVNCLLAMVGVWVGSYMTWLMPHYYAPAVTGLAAFFVCAAGNIINDIVDLDIDRINRPDRVLVKGTLSKKYALVLAIGLNVAAVILAVTVSWDVTILAVFTIFLLYLYNYRLKKVPVAGNVVISLLAGLTFITGGVAIDLYFAFELPGPVIGFIFAFLFHIVREIIKDIQDMEGDRASGIKTLPQIIGVEKTVLVALALFILLIVFTFLPILYGWYGTWYKIIAIYVVELPLLAFLIFLWGNPSQRMLKFASGWLKAGMALGIAALLLA